MIERLALTLHVFAASVPGRIRRRLCDGHRRDDHSRVIFLLPKARRYMLG